MLTPIDRLIWVSVPSLLIMGSVWLHTHLTYKNSVTKWFIDIIEEYYAPTLIEKIKEK